MTYVPQLTHNDLYDQFTVLSPQDCLRVYQTVMGLRDNWILVQREGALKDAPFYRLGSSWESRPGSLEVYKANCHNENPAMWENFGWLYEKVCTRLSEYFKLPVLFREDSSLPGFHIMQSDPIFGVHGAPWHTDFDSFFLNWEKPLASRDLRTVTIPVSLPKSGATLDVKDISVRDIFQLPRNEEQTVAIENAPLIMKIPHQLGSALIMNGQRYHRIGMLSEPFSPNDWRITLQGYLVIQGDHWVFHW